MKHFLYHLQQQLNTRPNALVLTDYKASMILGPSGQNIYPEEIEDQLNSLPGIAESLVVEREGHLVALVYPDALFTRKLGGIDHHRELILNRLKRINRSMPSYSQIASIEFVEHEFEKTPKRSIKRFLYK